MRTRIAMIGAAAAALGCSLPALALENPVVAEIQPLDGSNVRGNVTFFQMGDTVNVGVTLDHDPGAQNAFDLRKGTCKSYAETARWPLGTFDGTSAQTRLPSTKLDGLLGNVLLIHKSKDEASPVIGCAEIKG